MDKNVIGERIEHVYVHHGFPDQRMRVLPRALVSEALRRPVTARLLVTDCGYFPHASAHGRKRPRGIKPAIVIVCTDGEGWCRLPSGTVRISAGQVLVVPSGTPHSYGADDSRPWTIWWLHVVGTEASPLIAAAGFTEAAPVTDVKDSLRIAGLVEEVLARTEHDETDQNLVAAAGAAWHLLSMLATDRLAARTRSDPIPSAQDYLRNRIGTRVSIAELATTAGLSSSHFAALFREKTGFGVLEYQTSLRMGRARELLDTTDRGIAQIGAAVGYPDAFYFSRQFRTVHGVSPTEYRAREEN